MGFTLEVDWAPAYEFVYSLWAYGSRNNQKSMELGPAWAQKVRRALPDWFDQEYQAAKSGLGFPPAVVRWCPGGRTVAELLNWLETAPLSDMQEIVVALDGPALSRVALEEARQGFLRLFTEWHRAYFQHVDPQVLEGLAREAEALKARVGQADPVDIVAEATCGIRMEMPGLERLLLVPQYHLRPLNITDCYPGFVIVAYPTDPLPAPTDGLPVSVRRLIRALDDDSRLQLLAELRSGPRSFTELVARAGLAKSTVHHHLVTLRAAGLVWFHSAGGTNDRYSLRLEALDRLSPELKAYFKGE